MKLFNNLKVSATVPQGPKNASEFFLTTIIWNLFFPQCGVIAIFMIKICDALKVTLLHECFSRFLNCTNSAKSRKASHICNWYSYEEDFFLL